MYARNLRPKKHLLPASLLFLVMAAACSQKPMADLLVYNATIYTVDSGFSVAEAMAVKDGKIIATGSSTDLLSRYRTKQTLDASGRFVYPGFIDAHAHFVGYAGDLRQANLTDTKSWDEILDRCAAFEKKLAPGEWLVGRGWDQNDWDVKEFPVNDRLNELFPDRPVFLTRIDGHAAIANNKALEQAGVRPGATIQGGEIQVVNGKLSGILVDNATGLVSVHIPAASRSQMEQSLLEAQDNCFAVGLTTIDDCGLGYKSMEQLRNMQDDGRLKMRMYVMLSDAAPNYEYLEKSGVIKTDRMHVRSFKVYADGALGSRGACLLQPYSDRPGWSGFLLSSQAHFDSVARRIYDDGFQMCTHAIGDSGNRVMLQIYGKYLGGTNDRRWRIEHAQVISPQDFALFGMYNIVPSVQPTHATSDMYWAGDRLGPERIKGAYAFHDLEQQNGWIPLGTDFPVEDISPFKTFYAAVVRKDASGWPENGLQTENALTREDALRGMTIWAARSNFEEQEKGSLETGKWADFVILNKDLMKTPPQELLQVQVLQTFVGGEMVFQRK